MKGLVFIENDMYLRNFITSGAMDGLLNDLEFGVCTSEIATRLASAIPAKRFRGSFERCRPNMGYVTVFNKLSIRALRDRSSTFDIKMRTGWPFGPYSLKYRIASHPFVFQRFTRSYLLGKLRNNESIERIIREQRPEVVVFPITGVESTGYELVLLSRKYGFKTLFLVNGWDNLSSKGVFPILPDYLGVWGPQSLVDAVTIQGMPAHRVILLGSARYEDYLAPGNATASPFPHKYILFAGATTPCDEIGPLRIFEEILERSGMADVKVVYRPHPWRETRACFDTFEPENFRHVILDPQVADDYYHKKRDKAENSGNGEYPALRYYPGLLNHALFAISPMSSMTLEAALFDVPALVLSYDDGYHPVPGSLQARYRHFEGGRDVPGWFFADDIEQLKTTFSRMLDTFRDECPSNRRFRPVLSSAMGRYLYRDGRSYSQRLAEATAGLLCSNSQVLSTDRDLATAKEK